MSLTQLEMNRVWKGERKGVGVEVGVNNSYCKSFEETANGPWGEMESLVLVTVSNYQP